MSPLLLLHALLLVPAPALDLGQELALIRAGGEGRKQAVERISKAGPEGFEALVTQLGRKREGTPAQYRKVLDAIHAEYPDDKGVFRPPTRQQRELAAKRGEPDWIALLEEQGDALVAANPALKETVAETFEVTALVRGIAGAKRWERYATEQAPEARPPGGKPPRKEKPKKGEPPPPEEPKPGTATAISTLIDFAFSDAGVVFRDECGRQIRKIGNQAVPELIRYAFGLYKSGSMGGARQRYCLYQLDRLDRQNPARAVQTAPDDDLKEDLLRAYGETRATPALRVTMNELDAQSTRIRKIARWSWMQYVTVKPPPVPKRKRKLAGGKEGKKEEELYLDYRSLANLELRRSWHDLTGQELAEGDKRSLKELTDELFTLYDGRRSAVVGDSLKRAGELRDKGDLDGATQIYDQLLAEDPLSPRRGEMAPGYLLQAHKALGNGDQKKAAALLRQVESLAEGTKIAEDAATERSALEIKLRPVIKAPSISVPPSRRIALGVGLVVLLGMMAWMWRRA